MNVESAPKGAPETTGMRSSTEHNADRCHTRRLLDRGGVTP
jgi:hypothetical protein